jgi:hypothetical protein
MFWSQVKFCPWRIMAYTVWISSPNLKFSNSRFFVTRKAAIEIAGVSYGSFFRMCSQETRAATKIHCYNPITTKRLSILSHCVFQRGYYIERNKSLNEAEPA